MITQTVSHLTAIERGLLRVVAVRVDGYLGDVHYHAFSEDGAALECQISSTLRRDEVVQAVLEFAGAEVRAILTDLGFALAAADDATWEDVIGFLTAGVLTTFLAFSPDGIQS